MSRRKRTIYGTEYLIISSLRKRPGNNTISTQRVESKQTYSKRKGGNTARTNDIGNYYSKRYKAGVQPKV